MPSVAIVGTRGYPSYYGGLETAVRHLAPYLVDQGWDVTVYSRPSAVAEGGDSRIRSVVTGGTETRSLSTLSFGLTASAHAVRERPKVALIMNVANGFFLPFYKARSIPTVVNVDGLEWERDKWGRAAKTIFRAGASATARWANELVFDSRHVGDYWKSRFGRDGHYIPYGGDASEPLPVPLGLPDRGYALFVARLVPENTVGEFLKAAPIIARKYPVVIVGSSGYGGTVDAAVKDLAASNPNIMALGHIADDQLLYALWQHAGAYFHGHSVGGTNPALVQAMGLGAPVVARDTPYNREVLRDAGLFVEPEANAIAAKVTELLGDTTAQAKLSQGAMRQATATFTWDKVNRAYERLLAKAAGI